MSVFLCCVVLETVGVGSGGPGGGGVGVAAPDRRVSARSKSDIEWEQQRVWIMTAYSTHQNSTHSSKCYTSGIDEFGPVWQQGKYPDHLAKGTKRPASDGGLHYEVNHIVHCPATRDRPSSMWQRDLHARC